ncbi:hypothetical protein P691DRAFT_765273 [Macrolepiota fuliginosa MF-IS2]|uniref:Fungal-type protein kinase domain-containing protein n=1 Tax=Macrolepiota fuliginosa MF-IS2 TaxID=1400762 RepID=A0A9P6BW14_9AGAR|nr:hypothetical protein P691DRAFT_765273 [Macrolepiota fuliginosa MF-IS2]
MAATAAPNLLLCPHGMMILLPMSASISISTTTTTTTTTIPTKASGNIILNSTQTNASSGLLGHPDQQSGKPVFPCVYWAKKHYHLVYGQVGHLLNQAKNLYTSFTAIMHVYIVHWDVSVGNIILVGDRDKVQGKLNDLEYAKEFGMSPAGSDPKTGTLYFVPIEIHRSE